MESRTTRRSHGVSTSFTFATLTYNSHMASHKTPSHGQTDAPIRDPFPILTISCSLSMELDGRYGAKRRTRSECLVTKCVASATPKASSDANSCSFASTHTVFLIESVGSTWRLSPLL